MPLLEPAPEDDPEPELEPKPLPPNPPVPLPPNPPELDPPKPPLPVPLPKPFIALGSKLPEEPELDELLLKGKHRLAIGNIFFPLDCN